MIHVKQQLEAEKAEIAALSGGTAPVIGTKLDPNGASRPELMRALRAYDSDLASIGGRPSAAAACRRDRAGNLPHHACEKSRRRRRR